MLERLWASWRSSYVAGATAQSQAGSCVFCELSAGEPSPDTGVVHLGDRSFCVLNAYPYGSGHLLVLPRRHEHDLLALSDEELSELWTEARDAVEAVTIAYGPAGVNLGANLGEAAGAGIPSHLHLHVLPRWSGDTNFMTAIAETRVLPESLEETWAKVSGSWPSS